MIFVTCSTKSAKRDAFNRKKPVPYIYKYSQMNKKVKRENSFHLPSRLLCRVSILGLIKFHGQSHKKGNALIIKIMSSGYTIKKMIEQTALTYEGCSVKVC